MKKNKFTSIVSVISSIALVGSMASLPAYAMENDTNNTVLVSPVDDNTTNESAASVSSVTDSVANENDALVNPVDDNASNQAVNTETVTASPTPAAATASEHSHENETYDFTDDPNNLLPANVQTGQDSQIQSRAAISTFADSSTVDASDLSKWVVFDHYYSPTSASKPADWDTTTNSDGLHPWYYYSDASYAYSHPGEFYDLSGVGTNTVKTDYIDKVLNTKYSTGGGMGAAVALTNQHIFTLGDQNTAEMIFTGYGEPAYLDFALTKTPNTDTSLKSIAFDIDAAAINPHSAQSFGFYVNSGISGDTFKGQAVNFQLSGMTIQPQIKDLSSGVSVSSLHSGGVSMSGTNYGSRIDLTAGCGIIHVDIQVDNNNNKLTVEITPYSAPNVLDTANKQSFDTPLANTGYQAFGPFTKYGGHGCNLLSYVKFGNMQLSSNLDVYFWTNPNNGDKGDNFAVIHGIEKGNSINGTAGETMPSAPRQDGKSFKGWNTQADGNGQWFTGDTTLTNTTNVFAIWADSGVSVNYGTTTWTKDVVDVNFIISSVYPPEKVVVQFPGEPDQVITVTQNPSNPSEFIGKITVDKNKTGGTVTATVPDGLGNTIDLEESINVTLIDKEAPVIDNLPKGNSNHVLTFDDMNQVKFTDPNSPNANLNGEYSSGINDDTRTVYFFQNGQIVKETPWANLEEAMKNLPTGEYGYAVSVEDNVKHYNDSNDQLGGSASTGPKPDKPTVEDVIINPVAPTIVPNLTFKDGSGSYSDGSWTNKDVVVDYKVTDDFFNLTEVKENTDNVLRTEDKKFDKKFDLTKSGTYTYDLNAKNQAGLAADKKAVTINIDKDAPVVTVPAPNTVFTESAFNLEDVLSGVDTTKTKLVAVPYVNGKLGSTPIEIDDITSSNWSNEKLTEGVVYQFTLTGTDKAGNTASKTVDKIQYIKDPKAASNNKEIDLWGVALDGGNSKIYVESNIYPIETLSVSVAGGATTVIPTGVGSKTADFVRLIPSSQQAVITVKLTSGATITIPFSPRTPLAYKNTDYTSRNRPVTPAQPTLAVAKSNDLASNTAATKTLSTFNTAVGQGFELDGQDLTNITVKYMARRSGLGNYVTYANPAVLNNLARNTEYEIILAVTDNNSRKTYYVDGSDVGSTLTAPTAKSTGYKVKGV